MDCERVCIIGAGAAGIAAAYTLTQASVPFDWFEAGSYPGGLWRCDNDSGPSPVYDSLITNTSAPNMTLFGYRDPTLGNDYLSPGQVVRYLDSFMDSAGLRNLVALGTRVALVTPCPDGGFTVELEARDGTRSTRTYRAVIVANGRNSCPSIPVVPGSFSGRTLHALHYRTPGLFSGQRLVVAGFGNSGADIAVDACSCARRVVLSSSGGVQLLRRYVKGRPGDQQRGLWLRRRLPRFLRRWIAAVRRQKASPKLRSALESPAGGGGKPPVINDRIAALIEEDKIVVRQQIRRFDDNRIHFADGSSEEADVLVWATGYRTTFPFFSADLLARRSHFVERYFRVVPVDQPHLYFLGHLSVAGPVFPILEEQARWIAALLTGQCTLPGREKMRERIERQMQIAKAIFPDSARGEDNIEFAPYLAALRNERKGR